MSAVSAVRIGSKTPNAAVIFFHGLGDSGEGWSWFAQLAKRSNIIPKDIEENINYVFPNAPSIPITVNHGMRMPGWFDIKELSAHATRGAGDVEGFLRSCEVAKSLIKEQIETYNVPAERIILGGFSQGASIAFATLALLDIKIGGAVILSGFSPVKDEVAKNVKSVNFDTPIFQGHGTADNVLPFALGRETSEFYTSLGFKNIEFKPYPGLAHSADDGELESVQELITKILKK